MKKVGVCLLGVFIFMVFVFAYTAFAEERKDITKNIIIVFRPPSADEQKNISKQLQMTSEQNAKMKEVADSYQRDSVSLKNQYNAAYNDVIKLMQAEQPDKVTVNETLKRFNAIHSQLVDKEVEYWMQFKSVLTPEQNDKLWEIFEQSRIRR